MITGYQWDSNRNYHATVQVDESSSIPPCTTFTAPPVHGEGNIVRWSGSEWEVFAAENPVDADADVEGAKQALILSNNAAYTAAIEDMTASYPASEVATWERQRAEVVAWDADNSSPTPWIDIASSVRGVEREEYLRRTLAKVNAFASASAFYTGRRQGIDDRIKAATKAAQLDKIVIDYTLPEA